MGTVQILGAEKALFRALKTRGNTPKYGLIFHSSFIGRAGAKNKGRISRYLANKCSIASRIDAFSDESTSVFGTKLKEQVEDRLKFYETGDLPRKNVESWLKLLRKLQKMPRKRRKRKRRSEKRKMLTNLYRNLPLQLRSRPRKRKRRTKTTRKWQKLLTLQ